MLLALWLALVFILGAAGAFVRPAGQVPYPIALGVAAPLLVFVVAFWLSGTFRAYVLAIDLPLVTAVQAWRFAGFGFLALYAYDVLPPLFAWPAGLGDMAIGLTAPWVALAPRYHLTLDYSKAPKPSLTGADARWSRTITKSSRSNG